MFELETPTQDSGRLPWHLARVPYSGRQVSVPAATNLTPRKLPRQLLVRHRFFLREFGQQRREHKRLHLAAIIAPAEFLQIRVEMIFRQFVIAANHAAFE